MSASDWFETEFRSSKQAGDLAARPLDDITLLEWVSALAPAGVRLSVALAGRLVADLGAKVIKIEPPEGDPVRRMQPLVNGQSALFAFLNAGKRSVVLADEKALPSDLSCDGLLADGPTGPALAQVSARVRVEVSMLGGAASAGNAASEFTVLALGGLLNLVGEPDREPLRLGGHQAAYAGGLSAFTGLMGALCGDAEEVVRVSLLETAVWLNWKNVASAAVGGEAPSRAGRASDWPIIRCADGYVALVYQDRDWARLLTLLGQDARLSDPALCSLEVRSARSEQIAAVAEEHLGRMTRRQIRDAALQHKLPLGPVWEPRELLEDEHCLARGFFAHMTLGTGMAVTLPAMPALWDGKRHLPGEAPGLCSGSASQRHKVET